MMSNSITCIVQIHTTYEGLRSIVVEPTKFNLPLPNLKILIKSVSGATQNLRFSNFIIVQLIVISSA